MATSMQAVLDIRNLSFAYGKQSPTLKNISLTVEKSCIAVIGGESGCGKSTLLKIIAGFETPQNGEIYINGKLIATPHGALAPEKRNIGILFQDFALFPKMTIEQNVAFGIRAQMSAEKKRECINDILNRVKLYGAHKKFPHQLSIGQMQRAALARALVLTPPLLLLDEPFSNIDKSTTLHLIDELQEILMSNKTTVLYVTHESLEAMYLADKLMLMSNGSIQQVGSPEHIYDAPNNFAAAQYFDEVNFLPVTTSICKHLTTPCGFVEKDSIVNYDTLKNKDDFILCVRPHMMQIKSNRKTRYLQANWQVHRRHFMGTHYKIILKSQHSNFLGYEIIIIQKLKKNWPKIGEIVQIELMREKMWALENGTEIFETTSHPTKILPTTVP